MTANTFVWETSLGRNKVTRFGILLLCPSMWQLVAITKNFFEKAITLKERNLLRSSH